MIRASELIISAASLGEIVSDPLSFSCELATARRESYSIKFDPSLKVNRILTAASWRPVLVIDPFDYLFSVFEHVQYHHVDFFSSQSGFPLDPFEGPRDCFLPGIDFRCFEQ